MVGYGTIRACRSRYKIGPLFANDPAIAMAIFKRLCKSLPEGSEITLDVPDANEIAASMAVDCGLEPIFETARMYYGPHKATDTSKIFGITTFELG